eukprot:2987177-Lingulodinium_polyedra.AAC.1
MLGQVLKSVLMKKLQTKATKLSKPIVEELKVLHKAGEALRKPMDTAVAKGAETELNDLKSLVKQ